MNIVLDTNVLVSALWSADSKPAAIVNSVISNKFTLCYDFRILEEYTNVLHRPKFGFSEWQVEWLLDGLTKDGRCVIADSLSNLSFIDESDRKFLEVAKFCSASLITGNTKHYPSDAAITSVAGFYEKYF